MVILTLLDSQTLKPLQEWIFNDQNVIRIGRVIGNDLVLDKFPVISRYHLELKKTNNNWEIINLGKNGTFVNDKSVSSALLANNSLIQLAQKGPLLKFQIQSSSINSSEIETSPICNHQGNSPENLFCIHCRKPLVEEEKFIRNYQILKLLGQGGMGTTYLAYDRILNTKSAKLPNLFVLKEMNIDLIDIPKAQELFEREARILNSLNHPNIPKYYDFFEENNYKYLVMELIHGENLEQLIYRTKPVTEKRAINWILQLCDILLYLHSLSPPLVHRDIKPANIILRHRDQQVILLDFGAVKEIGTLSGTRIGAEGYSAPEQNLGQACIQSDLYAIGPTLIFLLTGENPLKYLKLKGNGYNFELNNIPNISPSLASIINKTCEIKLGDRYQNVQQLIQDLVNI